MTAVSDYWVTADVAVNATVVDQAAADPGVEFLIIVGGTRLSDPPYGFANFTLGPAVNSEAPDGVQWEVVGPSFTTAQFVGTVDTDTHTVEIHASYDAVANTWNPQLFIDGADQGLATGLDMGSDFADGGDSFVFFGGDLAAAGFDDLQVQFSNIKIGTSRGGNDLFDGSSLADTVVPPFDGEVGVDPADSLSASGGVLQAVTNFSVAPAGSDYAYASIPPATPSGGYHGWLRVGLRG